MRRLSTLVLVGVIIGLAVLAGALLAGHLVSPKSKMLTSENVLAQLSSSLVGNSFAALYRLQISDREVGLNYTATLLIQSSGRGVVLAALRDYANNTKIVLLQLRPDTVYLCKVYTPLTTAKPIVYSKKIARSKADLLALLLGDLPSQEMSIYEMLVLLMLKGNITRDEDKLVAHLSDGSLTGTAVLTYAGSLVLPELLEIENGTLRAELVLVKQSVYDPVLTSRISRLCFLSG